MREPTEIENQQYQRLQNLFAIARARYLNAGGNPNLSGGSFNGQDYLSEEEKQEIRQLRQQVFSRSNSSVM
jgi:hypothetical protein